MSSRKSTEADSFDAFFRATKKPLLAMAYVLTGDISTAQDLSQEALLRTWERWSRIGQYDSPEGWTRRVLHNLAVDNRRSARVRTRTAPEARTLPAPDDLHLSLAAALRSLPKDQVTTLILHDGAGMSIREVALQMSVPEGTVKSWLSRGRASAASLLSDSSTHRKEGHAQR